MLECFSELAEHWRLSSHGTFCPECTHRDAWPPCHSFAAFRLDVETKLPQRARDRCFHPGRARLVHLAVERQQQLLLERRSKKKLRDAIVVNQQHGRASTIAICQAKAGAPSPYLHVKLGGEPDAVGDVAANIARCPVAFVLRARQKYLQSHEDRGRINEAI